MMLPEPRAPHHLLLRSMIAATAVLATAACGPAATPPDPATPTSLPSPAVEPSPAASAVVESPVAVSLTRYVGHYPFDKVDGMSFLDAPAVVSAVEAIVPEDTVRRLVLGGDGPGAPIARQGGTLVAWGCETHDCGAHDWSILIAPDGSGAQVCYHDAAMMRQQSRWYRAGRKAELRSDDCPST